MAIKRKEKEKVLIISIIIVLILVLAVSFAYFSTRLNGTDQIVKVGKLELVLDETSEGISLENAIGLRDDEGMKLTPSTFKLINNGNKAVDYTIYLDDNTISDTDTRIEDKYLKYNLNKNGTDSGATLLTSAGTNPNRIIDSGTIEGGGTNTYSLNLWITDEVDGNYSGQVFSGKLRVEVSQERQTVAEALLADSANNINTTDPDQTFITGENPNNYIWYSGKLWRAVSIDTSDNSVKLVTQWNISAIGYNTSGNSAFEESHMEEWLNDTTVDGFLGNLRDPEKFIKMDSKWNASQMSDTSKPPRESEGGTIVEDPIGLLNIYEYTMSYTGTTYGRGYLNNSLQFWMLTPFDLNQNWLIFTNGSSYRSTTEGRFGIRPSINLKPNLAIQSGSGTEDDPYCLSGDNDKILSETNLNTRYSGEYIRFGSNENNLYRIVSHEIKGLTKVTSAEPLKENGSFKSIAFDINGNVSFSSNNTIGRFLNGEYLNSGKYLTNEQLNMIEDNTVWYIGHVKNGENYRLAKYTDISMTSTTINTTAKTGLLRYGELMSGQMNIGTDNANYWLINSYNGSITSGVIRSASIGHSSNFPATDLMGIKPAFNLKSNVVITSGDGTLQNPFEIELAS